MPYAPPFHRRCGQAQQFSPNAFRAWPRCTWCMIKQYAKRRIGFGMDCCRAFSAPSHGGAGERTGPRPAGVQETVALSRGRTCCNIPWCGERFRRSFSYRVPASRQALRRQHRAWQHNCRFGIFDSQAPRLAFRTSWSHRHQDVAPSSRRSPHHQWMPVGQSALYGKVRDSSILRNIALATIRRSSLICLAMWASSACESGPPLLMRL